MEHHDAIDVLSTLPAFRHLDDHDLEIIAASSTLVTCGSATVLVSASPRDDGPTDHQRTLLRRLMHT